MTEPITRERLVRLLEFCANNEDEEAYAAIIELLARLDAQDKIIALEVSVGRMEESNGKITYCGFLRRKGDESIGAGYQFASSSSRGRVDYEADRIRQLLDQSLPNPCVIDYDTNLPEPPGCPTPGACSAIPAPETTERRKGQRRELPDPDGRRQSLDRRQPPAEQRGTGTDRRSVRTYREYHKIVVSGAGLRKSDRRRKSGTAADRVIRHNPPFLGCKFQHCDLPGQCIQEGMCHHPKRPRKVITEMTPAADRAREDQIRESAANGSEQSHAAGGAETQVSSAAQSDSRPEQQEHIPICGDNDMVRELLSREQLLIKESRPEASAAQTVDKDARWKEIQELSRAVAEKDGAPSELEAALCGAVVRAREWQRELAAALAERKAAKIIAESYREGWIKVEAERNAANALLLESLAMMEEPANMTPEIIADNEKFSQKMHEIEASGDALRDKIRAHLKAANG